MERKNLLGVLFLLLSFAVVSVSAYVYDSMQQNVTQTIKEIATITLKSSALGPLEEGQTLFYTKANVTNFGIAISLTTTKANVYMHLSSDLASQSTYYSAFNVAVKIATKPSGGIHSAGETVCTLTLASPNSGSINLDVLGT